MSSREVVPTCKRDALWRDGAFLCFWGARTVSMAGTAVTMVLLPILIFQLTGSPVLTASVTAIEALPYLVFGLVAGAYADRANRRRLMIGCDLINAGLLASIPFASAAGHLTIPHVFAVALMSASVFVWFDSANFGALPALVGRERLVTAASALSSADQILFIAGPALGGILAATIGPAPALSIDALSYLLSAALLGAIKRPFQGDREEAPAGSARQRKRAAITEGLRFLWRHALLRTMTLVGFGNSFTGGALLGLMVVYGVEGLGLARDDARLGVLYATTGVGALIATLLLCSRASPGAFQPVASPW
ncbi:hypothetical protein BH20ACT22_BH20ACT22_12630 [soil metagenome]